MSGNSRKMIFPSYQSARGMQRNDAYLQIDFRESTGSLREWSSVDPRWYYSLWTHVLISLGKNTSNTQFVTPLNELAQKWRSSWVSQVLYTGYEFPCCRHFSTNLPLSLTQLFFGIWLIPPFAFSIRCSRRRTVSMRSGSRNLISLVALSAYNDSANGSTMRFLHR